MLIWTWNSEDAGRKHWENLSRHWHRQELPHKDSKKKFNKLWEGYKWTTT